MRVNIALHHGVENAWDRSLTTLPRQHRAPGRLHEAQLPRRDHRRGPRPLRRRAGGRPELAGPRPGHRRAARRELVAVRPRRRRRLHGRARPVVLLHEEHRGRGDRRDGAPRGHAERHEPRQGERAPADGDAAVPLHRPRRVEALRRRRPQLHLVLRRRPPEPARHQPQQLGRRAAGGRRLRDRQELADQPRRQVHLDLDRRERRRLEAHNARHQTVGGRTGRRLAVLFARPRIVGAPPPRAAGRRIR